MSEGYGSPALLADLVLGLHVLFILCVILPVPLILIGARRGWRWIRSPALRRIHLAMMSFVALESLVGVLCPLTVLEEALRGESRYGGSLVASWVRGLIYYDLAPSVFIVIYLLFTALIVVLYWRIPPRMRR